MLAMSDILYIIYLLIVFFCLIFSYKNIKQDSLWVYFSVVFIVEINSFLDLFKNTNSIYTIANIFYICFFSYYFFKENSKKIFLILGILGVFSQIYFLFSSNKSYPVEIGIIVSIIYIFISLIWFYLQIKSPQNFAIHKIRLFWVSLSLLLWAVFFIFRIIPMYWFAINDIMFLKQLTVAYKIVTILSYLLFLRSLFCKV